jgi:hypothetical protein
VLNPHFQGLSGDTLRFWSDAAERARAIDVIRRAWGMTSSGAPRPAPGDPAGLAVATAYVDRSVAQGLRALGFPRRRVQPRIVAVRGTYGVKYATCELHIAIGHIVLDDAETVADTWVHESLHGRRARSRRWPASTPLVGYEEGMAEGITLLIRGWAGWGSTIVAYPEYVRAYQRLAIRLGVAEETLYRQLWSWADVRAAFATVVDRLIFQRHGRHLSRDERARLRYVADLLFAVPVRTAGYTAPDDTVLDNAWGMALP